MKMRKNILCFVIFNNTNSILLIGNEKLRRNCKIMINALVKEYLSLSDKMRNGYKDSLEIASQTWS